MATLSVRTWIDNAASVLSKAWGSVTRQAAAAGCSRQSAYQHGKRVVQAVTEAQSGEPARAELQRQLAEVRAENQQLRERLESVIEFPVARQQQFAANAAAMGLSLQQIYALLTVVLAVAKCPSRATLGRWVHAAGVAAGRVLQVLDAACQQLVHMLCLDEIFFRRQPVLMGVEPHSLTWVMGQRTPDRSGSTWCAALLPWSQVTYVAADGGTGLRSGLNLVQEQRQEAGPALPLEANLDNFHIQQEGQRSLRREWQQAESLWSQAEDADHAKAKAQRHGQDLRHLSQQPKTAWAKAERAFEAASRREQAWQRAVAALSLFRPDGQLNDRTWATTAIAAAVHELTGPRWAKTVRMLTDPRSLTFLDRLQRELQEVVPEQELQTATLSLWRLRHAAPSDREPTAAARNRLLIVLQELICQKLDPAGWQVAYQRVAGVLRGTVRASSVVECMNSILRMHQARHRTLTQPLIDLKRLYWNCRGFAEGKRRGHCPYEHLGLKLPTYEWWELLQMGSEDLTQKVSSP